MQKHKNQKAQDEALEKSKNAAGFCYFMEPGMGKSRTVLQEIRALWIERKIDRALIFAPAGVYGIWEDIQIPEHLDLDPSEYDLHTWLGASSVTEKNRIKRKMFVADGKLKIFVMNIEAISNSTFGVQSARYFMDLGPSYLCIDESTTLKNESSRRSKNIHDMRDLAIYRRILTGTPLTNGPLDVFSQLLAVFPKPLGHPNFYSFRARYANMKTMEVNERKIKVVTSYKNVDELRRKLDEIAFFASKKDYLDIPDKQYAWWHTKPTAQQIRLIDELKEQWFSQISDIENEVVLVKNVLGLSLRIREILSGYVKDAFTDERVPVENNRVKDLMELLEYTGPGVTIWTPFHFNHYEIPAAIRKMGKTVGVYTGETRAEDRGNIIKGFEDGSLDYFVGSQAAGGRGITLIRAQNSIMYMNDLGVEKRIQTEDRNHRVGQRNSVVYTDMVCQGYNDEKLAQELRKGAEFAGEFMTKRAATEFLFG